jgi:hypothetical protein
MSIRARLALALVGGAALVIAGCSLSTMRSTASGNSGTKPTMEGPK